MNGLLLLACGGFIAFAQARIAAPLDSSVRHIGPMAQDFHAAFGMGADDKRITSVDADELALAAIQGLNQKLMARDDGIAELRQKNTELESRLAALEEIVAGRSSQGVVGRCNRTGHLNPNH
jgi:hypothetical protein